MKSSEDDKLPEEILDALLDAAQCLDDCLIRIYPEEFFPSHIEEAAERFFKGGGTINRIATIADKLRKIANKKEKPEVKGGEPCAPPLIQHDWY